jgi:hypothetical protein
MSAASIYVIIALNQTSWILALKNLRFNVRIQEKAVEFQGENNPDYTTLGKLPVLSVSSMAKNHN